MFRYRKEGGKVHLTHIYWISQGLKITPGPSNDTEATDIQDKMGLKCRYILGEIIFAYMTGRTDISYAVAELLKLSGNQ